MHPHPHLTFPLGSLARRYCVAVKACPAEMSDYVNCVRATKNKDDGRCLERKEVVALCEAAKAGSMLAASQELWNGPRF